MNATREEVTAALSRIAYSSRGQPSPRARHPFAADRSWAFGDATGTAVRVCVIDSGIELGVAGLPVGTAAFAVVADDGGTMTVVPDDQGDAAGHGTACASIIAGLAPGIELSSVRILGAGLRGQGTALITALEWAVANQFHLVNLSLSTKHPDYREAIRDLVDRAYFQGVTIVASANNRPVVSFPWQFPAVISAAAHARPDPEHLECNPEPPVEFFGHGVGVLAAQPGNRFARLSGNSFATPHVTGLCARVLGAHPGLQTPQLKVVLAAISDNIE